MARNYGGAPVAPSIGGRYTPAMPDLPLPPRFDLQDVELKLSARARRMTLRVHGDGRICLTVPRRTAKRAAAEFVASQSGWIAQRLAALPPAVPLADGATVPFRGAPHRIRHDPARRIGVTAEGGELVVGGGAEFVGRRLRDFMIREARRELWARAAPKAAQIGCRVAGLSIKDTRSRWGSCSRKGRLNFSWRLIMAPEAVLDYLVAHEVAHLREHNHGPDFWALCASLCADSEGSRAWLKRHGDALMRVG